LNMQRRQLLATSMALAGSAALPAWAQSYPSKTVRIIVPALVGSADVFARALAQRLTPVLGQTVMVEQKPGAGTNIGNDFVAKAAPDGHTLLINGLPLVTNSALFTNLPYNAMRDLVPVIEVAEVTNVVTVHPSLNVSSLKELVQLAKNDPNRFNHGTPGAGSSGHLSAELLTVKMNLNPAVGRLLALQTLDESNTCAHDGLHLMGEALHGRRSAASGLWRCCSHPPDRQSGGHSRLA
jgi:tripartite-type tricarboxylate transporter receptor subunit TctC